MSGTVHSTPNHQQRIVDSELDQLRASLSAIGLEGPKGVGKTFAAVRRAGSVFQLVGPGVLEIILAQPDRLTSGDTPTVIDEWQRYPACGDLVRRSVDKDSSQGRFILTGSATPMTKST